MAARQRSPVLLLLVLLVLVLVLVLLVLVLLVLVLLVRLCCCTAHTSTAVSMVCLQAFTSLQWHQENGCSSPAAAAAADARSGKLGE